ncbi:MAG: TonB family protein [Acidobacteria bacterium]|nr:TonB family protein [Acidobacteriota bacterium]
MCKFKSLACTFICGLLLAASVCAQSKDETAAAAQTPEVQETVQMSERVVHLFSEQYYDQALDLAKRVLEIREKALAPENKLVGEALYNLAEIYVAKNMYKEAEPYYQRLLDHYEKAYGADNSRMAKTLERLAYISYRMENLDEAEKRVLRALAIYEKSPAANAEQLTFLTLQLAELYKGKGDKKKAEAAYLRAIEFGDQLEEPPGNKEKLNDSAASKAYEGYVCFLYETKSPEEARKIERRLSEERNKAAKAGRENSTDDEILNGRALSLPRPAYPSYAKSKRVEGVVRVRVLLNERGEVIDAKSNCGPVLLREAAVRAAYGARFTPTLLSGRPVKVTGVINYNFKLSRF